MDNRDKRSSDHSILEGVAGSGLDNKGGNSMDFSLNRMPSTQREIEWQWGQAVKDYIDFSSINVNGINYDFDLNIDYFNMTDAKADQLSFVGRRYDFFGQSVNLKDFRLEIFGDIHQDTQIGMILNGINHYREEASPYGLFASYRYIGKSVYCAITVCLVDKDWGSEMDVAVLEISQDENAYVLPVEISEDALAYFSFDDIMRLAYWLGNFWVGVQYEINNRPEEIRIVEQRGPISPDDDEYKSQDKIVLIKRIIAVDKAGRPIEYGAVGSGRKYHVPSWGVRGHERTLSDGRVIPVRPYRKGKERNNPEIYKEKQYKLDDKKINEDTLNKE